MAVPACYNPEHQMLADAVRAQDQFIGEQNEQLRRLLAWCKAPTVEDEYQADFVADVLARILNNVTGVETEVGPDTGLDK